MWYIDTHIQAHYALYTRHRPHVRQLRGQHKKGYSLWIRLRRMGRRPHRRATYDNPNP